MISTIRDVTRKTAVTDTTVTLVFQNHPRISKATRRRVLTVARAMNYSPNLSPIKSTEPGLLNRVKEE